MNKKLCVIFDIDGTIFNVKNRLHFITCDKKDFNSFYESTYLDTLNINIVKKLKLYKLLGMDIHLYTCVPNKYRRRTIDRLKKYNLPFNRLYMRKNNDFRKDYIVKSEWLDLNNFKYLVAYDDKKHNIDMFKLFKINGVVVNES